MILKVVVVVPIVLRSRLVLFVLVMRFLVTVSILLVAFLIATASVSPTLSILIVLLTKLTARVVTIIFLGWRLSDSLVGTRFDI